MIDVRRGDVVLVAFPFVSAGRVQQKRRPALVIQSDRYNRRRSSVIMAAITTNRAQASLPCKLLIEKESADGQHGGLKLDSVIDCQTLVTVPKDEVVRRLGRLSANTMRRADEALADALGLPSRVDRP